MSVKTKLFEISALKNQTKVLKNMLESKGLRQSPLQDSSIDRI